MHALTICSATDFALYPNPHHSMTVVSDALSVGVSASIEGIQNILAITRRSMQACLVSAAIAGRNLTGNTSCTTTVSIPSLSHDQSLTALERFATWPLISICTLASRGGA